MVASLLETKLHVPRVRPGVVVRPRLVDGLRRGSETRLILISAPAGSGKTTLLADWVANASREHGSLAWLSLDANDNEPATFWEYVIAALRKAAPKVGTNALDLLQKTQQSISELALTSLLNDLSAIPDRLTLILDDYHAIHAPEVQAGMAFFLEHLPEQINLVIATRSDPALPLARLRARAELVEIRAADLRFTANETDAYLNEIMGLRLTTNEVVMLEERTEGWIAALQLAALSMQGREDTTRFIAGFAGSDRYIVDYLVEEVLQLQPEPVRSFLLETSILDRLTGSLCDVVTGHEGGNAMLEKLDRANLFTVPLDDHRRWYRYHRLFADVLQARLLDEQPSRALELHRRASAWWERNGERSGAIRHSLAGEDYGRAADLVELELPELRRRRQEQTMREWLDAIPDDLFETRPVLAIGYVGSRLVSGDLEGVETRLQQAERWLGEADQPHHELSSRAGEMVVLDDDAFRRLPGAVAVYRIALARASGDVAGTIALAERALDVIAAEDHLERGGAAGFLALAHWSRGELDDSCRRWADAAESLEKAGHISDVLGCHIAIGLLLIEQGRFRDALRNYQRGLELASGAPAVRGVADMHVGISHLFREWNDLVSAREHLQIGEELGEHAGLAQNAYRSRVAKARVVETEGDLDAAIDLLDEAERLYTSDYFPNVQPIAAMRARVWIRQGMPRKALDWALAEGLSAEDDLGYLREFEHVTLAHALVADAIAQAAADHLSVVTDLLDRLLVQAESGGRTGNTVEILILQALARGDSDRRAALASLETALTLSEPEGYVRVFADHGTAIAPLLKVLAKQSSSNHARWILDAVDGFRTTMPGQGALVEPLTERELDVLRLLSSDLTGPDIARRLFISLNTLRTHTKSIYTKLGANSRRTAIRRATELGLLRRL